MDKRQKILFAAESLMSKKGKQTTISEIGHEAKVNDSIIYRYFKNKEDLLFSVAEEHMKKGHYYLDEQLQGIKDPISRLSKMIWFTLYYYDTNQDYARLLLFECRPNKNFRQHQSFDLIKKWARTLQNILEDGVRRKEFIENIDLHVVRDIILGLCDMESIQYLAGHQNKQAHYDLDDIMELVIPMITKEQNPFDNDLNRYQRLLNAAEIVFAEKSYVNATIQDIARTANVAEGTIYEYFQNKEDLLFSTLKVRFQDHLTKLEEIFEIKSPMRKLRRFMRYHFYIYLTQPSFVKIFLNDALYNMSFYSSESYKIFQKYIETLNPILEEGKAFGSIRKQIKNRIFTNLFLGAFCHMSLRWLFAEDGSKVDKTHEINEAIWLLEKSCKSLNNYDLAS